MLLTSDYASYFIIMRLHVLHGPYCCNVLDFLIIIQSLIIESTLLSSFTNLHTFKCNHCHHCTYDTFAAVGWCFLYPYGWVFHYFVMFHPPRINPVLKRAWFVGNVHLAFLFVFNMFVLNLTDWLKSMKIFRRTFQFLI